MLQFSPLVNGIVAAAFFLVAGVLIHAIWRRRRHEPTSVLVCFILFLFSGGINHLVGFWSGEHADEGLAAAIKVAAAILSLLVAIVLIRLVPRALSQPTTRELQAANAALQTEVKARHETESALRQSQQMFQRLFEHAPDALLVIDRAGRIARSNARALSLFHTSAGALAGRHFETLVPERFRAQLAEFFPIPLPPDLSGGIELAGRRDDGSEFPADIMLSPLDLTDDPHALAVIRDITERTRASEALAASENRYRTNFESLPVALFETDFTEVLRMLHRVRPETGGDWKSWLSAHPEFVAAAMRATPIVDMNPMALRLLGATTKQEVIDALPVIFSAPEVVQHFAEDLVALERGELTSTHETLGRRIDGSPIAVLQTVSFPRPATRGRALFSAIDITERKQAERERDQFFELSHDLFGITDFEGYFKRLNPAWENVLGYRVSELIGTHFSALVDPDDLPATLVHHEQVRSHRGEHLFELRYRARDGSYRWMSGVAVSDPQHQLIYFTLRDISDRRKSEDEIRRQNAQLETINRELEAFSYSISHDLRAPLRHIDGFANLLIRHGAASLDDTGRRYLKTISDSAAKLGQLVDDLLNFSRIGRTALSVEPINHDALVAEIIRENRYAEKNQITWRIGPLPAVRGSTAMIRQVWTNLLDNAVKYSRHRSSPEIEISGETDEAAGEHRYAVRDNGMGFDMAYAGKLFGVFQRLHGSTEIEGTGIGLANVRRIILRHGGRVWAEGRIDQGATFHFALPIVAAVEGSLPPFSDT